jgi:hypothetical protein
MTNRPRPVYFPLLTLALPPSCLPLPPRRSNVQVEGCETAELREPPTGASRGKRLGKRPKPTPLPTLKTTTEQRAAEGYEKADRGSHRPVRRMQATGKRTHHFGCGEKIVFAFYDKLCFCKPVLIHVGGEMTFHVDTVSPATITAIPKSNTPAACHLGPATQPSSHPPPPPLLALPPLPPLSPLPPPPPPPPPPPLPGVKLASSSSSSSSSSSTPPLSSRRVPLRPAASATAAGAMNATNTESVDPMNPSATSMSAA